MTGVKIPFLISEYIARPDLPVTVEVMDKILQHHIRVMLPVRAALGASITVSQKSGFRHPIHEKEKGRSGTGEHTYSGTNKGAADYTVAPASFLRFAELMAQSEYTRLCFYPKERFIHADHKATTKQFFTQQTPADGWKVVASADEWLSAIKKAVEGWSK